MRGKGDGMQYEIWYNRITPAYAGKRCQLAMSTRLYGDHPRLCGEKTATKDKVVAFLGSPPPMRGKVTNNAVCWQLFRITPAYAGKSRPYAKR